MISSHFIILLFKSINSNIVNYSCMHYYILSIMHVAIIVPYDNIF
jgi:hypothetical protein